ncbi:MAG TPA: outer membrane beta-barrel protein [Roseiarcus sp.]|nr:outer membrane beta-barrel protein [Roseiarcus sp.]
MSKKVRVQKTVASAILGGALAASLFTGATLAADLPYSKAPPPPANLPPPPLSWTGFYVGLNAGYAWGNADFTAHPGGSWIGDPDAPGVLAAATRTMSLSSGTVTGAIGYNRQFDRIVAGLEVDGGWMGLRDPVVTGPFPSVATGIYGASSGASSDYLVTVRGRLGFTFTPTLLLFASGGLALSNINQAQTVFFSNPAVAPAPVPSTPTATGGPQAALPITGPSGGLQNGAASGTQAGWAVGGGLEWMFLPNWSAKVEYLHADFGKQHMMSLYVSPLGSLWAIDHEFGRELNIVRAGLSYHFNFGGEPILANY